MIRYLRFVIYQMFSAESKWENNYFKYCWIYLQIFVLKYENVNYGTFLFFTAAMLNFSVFFGDCRTAVVTRTHCCSLLCGQYLVMLATKTVAAGLLGSDQTFFYGIYFLLPMKM